MRGLHGVKLLAGLLMSQILHGKHGCKDMCNCCKDVRIGAAKVHLWDAAEASQESIKKKEEKDLVSTPHVRSKGLPLRGTRR